MTKIFVSYRRDSSSWVAGTLRDSIEAAFGQGAAFLDVDNIPLGVDFRKHLDQAVGQCDILLAVIANDWLGIGPDNIRRIDGEKDFVRIEIESALRRGIPVIPVLIENAKMPDAEELPSTIRDVAYRQATVIRSGRDRRNDIDYLLSGMRDYLKSSGSSTKTQSKQVDPQRAKYVPVKQSERTAANPTPQSPVAQPHPQPQPVMATVVNEPVRRVDTRVVPTPIPQPKGKSHLLVDGIKVAFLLGMLFVLGMNATMSGGIFLLWIVPFLVGLASIWLVAPNVESLVKYEILVMFSWIVFGIGVTFGKEDPDVVVSYGSYFITWVTGIALTCSCVVLIYLIKLGAAK